MVHSFRGKTPDLHPSVFIAPGAQVVGDVTMGENCSLWFNVVVRGDVNTIRIGRDTNVQDNSVLHVTHQKASLRLGNGVTVGHMVTLHGCTIDDYVLVGMRACVMDDAEIGSECIIGAGALVTQGTKIPPRSLVIGSPAKVARALTDEEVAMVRKSAENYKQYVAWYRQEKGFAHGTDR